MEGRSVTAQIKQPEADPAAHRHRVYCDQSEVTWDKLDVRICLLLRQEVAQHVRKV